MPAHDSGISLVQTNKKAQFIHMRTKRALFRGTTSFRQALPAGALTTPTVLLTLQVSIRVSL